MKTILYFLVLYPKQSVVMILVLLLASISEGLSAATILPLLTIANATENSESTNMSGALSYFMNSMSQLGIKPTAQALIIVIMIGLVLKNVLLLFINRYIGYVTAQLQTDLRLEFLQALASSRWKYFLNQPVGQLSNLMSIEITRAAGSYTQSIIAVSLAITALVYVITSLVVSWQATIMAVLAAIFAWTTLRKLTIMARKAGKRQTSVYRSLMSRLSDTVQSMKLFKTMAKERNALSLIVHETEELNSALRLEAFGSAALDSMQQILYILMIGAGIFFALSWLKMSVETVITLTVLLIRVLLCTGKAHKKYQSMLVLKSAYHAVKQSINEAKAEPEIWSGTKAATLDQSIKLEDLSFSYSDTDQNKKSVLANLSLTIQASKMTMLLGTSGSGKSTMIDLITGLQNPDSGQILIDGINLKDIDLISWRQCIGYVPQEGLLLHDSILNNMRLGDETFTEADIYAALESIGTMDLINKLENGLQTTVGERGLKLSGGQRQRIMIARALLSKPRLLILDEATNALDPTSERQIFDDLLKIKHTMTMLVVSHRHSLAVVADRVYDMSDGIIKEVTVT